MFCRHWQMAGFDAGARETILWIGTVNLAILLTSGFVYSTGLVFVQNGYNRGLVRCCLLTMALGTLFLVLKIYEWHIDLSEHLFPAGPFKLAGSDT